MPALNSQILYNWAGDVEGKQVGEEGDVKEESKVPTLKDFVGAMQNAEAAMGQKILQDNAETRRLSKAVADAGLDTLDGTATLADVIAAINNTNTFLSTQLVKIGKQ